MFIPINGINEKYRIIKNENIGEPNLNSFFTFDNVFEITSRYLRWKTESFLNRELVSIEYPDRDKTHQLLNESDKVLSNKNILPRAILMYEMNPMDEDLVNIPTLNTHFDINNGMTAELFAIRKSRLSSNIIQHLDVYRDIDVGLYGHIGFTSALIFYTVLLDNRVEAIELQKQLKMNFPMDTLHDMYRHVVRTNDTTGKTDNTNLNTSKIELIPHSLKTVVPDSIIEYLKDAFGLSDSPDSDGDLETILKAYSYNYITREVDGSSRKVTWTTTYKCIPILVPKSIQTSHNVRGMKETSAVRIEFQLSYIEIKTYKLRAKYKVLSYENESNYIENRPYISGEAHGVIKAETLKLLPNIGDCVRVHDLQLAYEKEDLNSGEMQLYLPDIINSRDQYLGKYMEYLSDSTKEEDHLHYRVVIKHGSNQTVDVDTESSTGTYFSYDDLSIYDTISKVDEKIFVVIYLNNTLYKEWKIKMGFEEIGNMSSKYLKRN